MEIKFINHSSTLFIKDGINLIIDPWIEGKIFRERWSLLADTQFKYSDFEQITHIWFSDECPDHFFQKTLKQFLRSTVKRSLYYTIKPMIKRLFISVKKTRI